MRVLLISVAIALVFVLSPLIYFAERATGESHNGSGGLLAIGVAAGLAAFWRER